MKSASNGGVLNGSLQVLHVHVLLVAPLGTGYMAQPGTDSMRDVDGDDIQFTDTLWRNYTKY